MPRTQADSRRSSGRLHSLTLRLEIRGVIDSIQSVVECKPRTSSARNRLHPRIISSSRTDGGGFVIPVLRAYLRGMSAAINDWQILQTVALASLLAWASGIRLYLVIFAVGLAGYLGYVDLPPGLKVLQHPWVIGAAGFMLVMEFLVDKVPALDSTWDAIHTFIRIPAGALLAAGATGNTLDPLTVVAGLLGGTITAGTHFTKSGGRALINLSPEPVSNWTASFTEDALVLGGIWFAFNHPLGFLIGLAAFIAMMIWLLPKLWRGIQRLFRILRGQA